MIGGCSRLELEVSHYQLHELLARQESRRQHTQRALGWPHTFVQAPLGGKGQNNEDGQRRGLVSQYGKRLASAVLPSELEGLGSTHPSNSQKYRLAQFCLRSATCQRQFSYLPHVHPPPKGRRFPPTPGGTVHHSRPANSSITQLKVFFNAFGACDFLLISYCSWAK